MNRLPAERFFEGSQLALARAIIAVNVGDVDALARKVEINLPGRDDMTLLVFALAALRPASAGELAVVETLVRAGADPLQEVPNVGAPVDYAFTEQEATWMAAMLRGGLSANARRDDQPVLLDAVHAGREMARVTLDAGADIHATNGVGHDALMQALYNVDLDTADFLLSRGADPTRPDHQGNTAAHVLADVIDDVRSGTPSMRRLEALRDRMIGLGAAWPPN
jgi:hypothetical protein